MPSSGLWSSQARHPCSAPKCTQALMRKIPIYFYKRILHKFLLSLFSVTMIEVGRLNFNLGNLRHEKVKCKVKTKPERATPGPFDVQRARLHHPPQHVRTSGAALYPAVSTASREDGASWACLPGKRRQGNQRFRIILGYIPGGGHPGSGVDQVECLQGS